MPYFLGQLVYIDDYNIFQKDRDGNGGGVIIYLIRHFTAEVIELPPTRCKTDVLAIKITDIKIIII